MRTRSLLALLLLSATAQAQNWALLNPSYKYNYSNDGTDTISNQIFVTHIDTLGVDSFNYSLNLVAELCFACADTCDLRLNMPQFLLGRCRTGTSSWSFASPGELIIRPRAAMGEQWSFNVEEGTEATLSEISEELIFGTLDSVRTMTTSLNDTVRWSKNFGILHWHMHNGTAYHTIGIQGLPSGVSVPSLEDFFRYQPGDIVQFHHTFCSGGHCGHRLERFEIQQRIEQPGHLEFFGPLHERHVGYYGEVWYTFTFEHTWVVDSMTDIRLRPLSSWPGQAMTLDGMPTSFIDEDLLLVAKHYQDNTGAYVITGENYYNRTLVDILDSTSADCSTLNSYTNIGGNFRLDTELGLRLFSTSYGYEISSFQTMGAIISGDTVGTFYDDAYFNIVGNEESDRFIARLYPNPAYDLVTVPNSEPGETYSVFDAQGRPVIMNTFSTSFTIDVRSLQPGSYVLKRQNHSAQRFIIIR